MAHRFSIDPPRLSWLVPAIRLLGLFVLALAVPPSLQSVASAMSFFKESSHTSQSWVSELLWNTGPILQLLIACLLLIRPRTVAEWCCGGVHGRCPGCGYDIRGIALGKCP